MIALFKYRNGKIKQKRGSYYEKEIIISNSMEETLQQLLQDREQQ